VVPPLRADGVLVDRVVGVGPFPPPELPGLDGTMDLSEAHAGRSPCENCVEATFLHQRRASPNYSDRLPNMPSSLPRWAGSVLVSVASRSVQPSLFLRQVGAHDFTFEACSRFTRVTACWIAHPPYAGLVTRLHSIPLPASSARQLPCPTDYYMGGSLLHW
jgi:hypothetical protein